MLPILFWLAGLTIIYTFIGYGVLISLSAKKSANPVRQAAITPLLTLLIPAYNEEAVIAAKLENSLNLDYPPDLLKIIVVTDGSTDATPEIANGYAKAGVVVYHQSLRRGKAAAVNRVLPVITGEIVVFSDANTMLVPDTLKAIVRNFADQAVGGVAGEKRVLGGGEGLYWRYESYLKKCDSALTSVMGAAGELFAIRRELFVPVEEDTVIEDFVMSLRLVLAGWRVVYEPQAIATEPPTSSLGAEWQRRTRIAAGGFQAIGWLIPLLNPARGLVAWQYFSHRVLRWAVTPFLLPLVYLLNLALLPEPVYLFAFVAQTLFYGLALAGFILTKFGVQQGILYAIFYFCFTNAAALVGFWRFCTKTQPVTWIKVR